MFKETRKKSEIQIFLFFFSKRQKKFNDWVPLGVGGRVCQRRGKGAEKELELARAEEEGEDEEEAA